MDMEESDSHMKTEVVKSRKGDEQEHSSIDDGHEKCH